MTWHPQDMSEPDASADDRVWTCSVCRSNSKEMCVVEQVSAHAAAIAHQPSKRHQKALIDPDGTTLSKASSQDVKGKGKPTRSQPPKSQSKARAAPKQKRKTGIVQSLAATDAEIEQSFSMLLPSRDGTLTVDSLQQVWLSFILECCNGVSLTVPLF